MEMSEKGYVYRLLKTLYTQTDCYEVESRKTVEDGMAERLAKIHAMVPKAVWQHYRWKWHKGAIASFCHIYKSKCVNTMGDSKFCCTKQHEHT
jgi:hypothetical protein